MKQVSWTSQELAVIETIARAMAEAEGVNPDADEIDRIKGWQLYEPHAIRHLIAHRILSGRIAAAKSPRLPTPARPQSGA